MKSTTNIVSIARWLALHRIVVAERELTIAGALQIRNDAVDECGDAGSRCFQICNDRANCPQHRTAKPPKPPDNFATFDEI
ncbi:MAG: hypothetical protein H0V56_00725 [Chthoniobacterales bacterium]|nr:hypothetical protein [Chthoniobacterales bacterium]